jgi:FkbM family methyltransferase
LQLPVSPLFDLVNELVSKIDVLKIDIEGFEFRVLLKFQNLRSNSRSIILFLEFQILDKLEILNIK